MASGRERPRRNLEQDDAAGLDASAELAGSQLGRPDRDAAGVRDLDAQRTRVRCGNDATLGRRKSESE